MSQKVKAIIKKEWLSLSKDSQTIAGLLIVPFIFCVLLPLILYNAPLDNASLSSFDISSYSEIFSKYLPELGEGTLSQVDNQLLYLVFNYLFLPMFILIPVMIATVIAGEAFVGERFNKTLEGLLFSPISVKELLVGKLLASGIPAILVSWLSFLLYAVIYSVGWYIKNGEIRFLGSIWFYLVFLLVPLVTSLVIVLVFFLSPYMKSVKSSQSISLVFLLPIVAVLYGQLAGSFFIGRKAMLVSVAMLLLVNAIVIGYVIKSFDKEKYIIN